MEHFNPRSPQGGATDAWIFDWLNWRFQSTLPARGSDDFLLLKFYVDFFISIHAPRKGERRQWRI